MATAGAYKNTAFTFNYSFVTASDPTALFTGSFTSGEVKVITRDGTTTNAAANITTLPTHESNGVFEINLSASEMNHDEVVIVLVPSAADVVVESISITTEPTPADILEVQGTAVTGVSDFKANVASLATSAEIAALNDIAATDIVTAGPITTLSGAVVNVDTVDVTTTNTDMRGTDGAYTGTPATAGQIADAVWDESYSAHTTAGTFGKLMDIIRKANLSVDGTVSGTPTASAFDTNLTDADGAHNHQLLLFVSGSLTGYSSPIDTYVQSSGRITLQEALTAAPSASDEFVILPQHVHPIDEIQSGLATASALSTVDSKVDTIDGIVDAILLDTGTDGVVISTAQAQAIADEVLKRSVTDTQDSADAHSLAAIVLAILESSRSSTTWTIRKTTGSTFTTKTLTLDSAAQPVTGVD